MQCFAKKEATQRRLQNKRRKCVREINLLKGAQIYTKGTQCNDVCALTRQTTKHTHTRAHSYVLLRMDVYSLYVKSCIQIIIH